MEFWAEKRRIPTTKKSDKGDDVEPIQLVIVGEVPQVVRDEQANIFQKRLSGDTGIYGGMDKGTSTLNASRRADEYIKTQSNQALPDFLLTSPSSSMLEGSSRTVHILEADDDREVNFLVKRGIRGTDGDVGIQKGLAGQKKIWPLDMQIDNNGKVIIVLVATFCKDRATSSSYTEYSLLTMQYKSGLDITSESAYRLHDKILERQSPIEVIIPKARVEEEDFLTPILNLYKPFEIISMCKRET
nr:nuclear pore complex protein NUP133 [Tanacetum cinerariifolium]